MKKILVIEDALSIREEILEALECLEYEAIAAESGRVGIELAHRHLPDLVICDIMMPELDGYGVLQALRSDPETASIPFIFLSAKADKSDIRHGMNLGADDYLTKPFTIAELQEAIAARLSKQDYVTQPYVLEMKRAAEHLSQLAYRDPLTNLPNRILLRNRLQEALSQAKRQNTLVAVLSLDIKRFQWINNSLGHLAGDMLLQTLAQRLTHVIEAKDTVARLSGDEFSVILTGLSDRSEVEPTAKQLIQALSAPYVLRGQEVSIEVCMGISIYPEDDTHPDSLLNRADRAMRHAKTHVPSDYQFYRTEMDAIAAEKQQLEAKLKRALERQELQLYYQPQVHLVTGRIIGVEALIRWQHPEDGLISPSRFIGLAEETGLIVPMGEWILRTACTQVQSWQGMSLRPLRLSVNLSARQFNQTNLIEMIAQTLEETGLPPNLLSLELTETSVMENVEKTIITLHQLKAMGIQISIDDFGMGYSSLNYLKRFPIDTLKIDQSFIREIPNDAHDTAITTAIIAMAQSLKLRVIAEGVETATQLEFLRKNGCHGLQGYWFSPAIAPKEFEDLLLTDKRLESRAEL